ncbi:MAG: biotin--[acetyl-CoA-carboxylase] ligase [Prevotellaceae bacterium]|jgi:BirA family biotin operon repressor/biotin-[acetyl-CoA-carboxylase] ligase|nr:biotin--[acetyl-CoA-carboxylase] ligase [Prevotellaceae bacterium]
MLFNIKHYQSLESTNSEAVRLASAGASEGTVTITENQTAGRGQRNNVWESEPGKNLTFTLILRPHFIPVHKLFILSKAFGLSVVKAMDDIIPCSVKWPNDIYTEGRKLAGILLEHSFSGDSLLFSVIGAGVNINQSQFSPEAPNATSLFVETGKVHDTEAILSSILHIFSEYYEQLRKGEYSEVQKGYFDKLYCKTGYHAYITPQGERFCARIADIYDSGELVLETENGEKREFLFKQIVLDC